MLLLAKCHVAATTRQLGTFSWRYKPWEGWPAAARRDVAAELALAGGHRRRVVEPGDAIVTPCANVVGGYSDAVALVYRGSMFSPS